MAEDFRLPIFDFRLNRSPHSQSKIKNQKSAQENDAIAGNNEARLAVIGTFGMFVRFPEPGRVKTRLAAAIGDEWATALYRAFLIDLIPRYSDLRARRVLAYSPNNEVTRRYFEHLSQGAFELWPQPDGPLSRRLQSFFEAFGPEPTVLIGSDSPTLAKFDVEYALQRLQEVDCVLGPATDGGLYLIGHKGGPWPIFSNVEWSTSRVLEQILAEARRCGASLEVLPIWYDVDTLDDLNFLRGHLAALKISQPTLLSDLEQTKIMLDVIDDRPVL
jgi:uncharacterized protein